MKLQPYFGRTVAVPARDLDPGQEGPGHRDHGPDLGAGARHRARRRHVVAREPREGPVRGHAGPDGADAAEPARAVLLPLPHRAPDLQRDAGHQAGARRSRRRQEVGTLRRLGPGGRRALSRRRGCRRRTCRTEPALALSSGETPPVLGAVPAARARPRAAGAGPGRRCPCAAGARARRRCSAAPRAARPVAGAAGAGRGARLGALRAGRRRSWPVRRGLEAARSFASSGGTQLGRRLAGPRRMRGRRRRRRRARAGRRARARR